DDVGGVESTAVCHRGGTRQVIRRRSSTGPGENRIRGTGYATDSHMSGHIGVQNLGAKRVGIVGLRPGREGRVRERHDVVSRGSRRTQSLYTEEEEELVMRNDGAADCSGEVIAVERVVRVVRAGQRVLSE